MTEDEQRIAGLQETLDDIATRIDAEFEAGTGEDALFWRLMHAHTSALIHLLKKGQDVEYRDVLMREKERI